MVAVLAHQEWPRFFAGFLGMFVITQMHGIGLSKATRWILGGLYVGAVALIYAQTKGVIYSYEAAMIPLVEFLLVVIVSLIFWLVARLVGGIRQQAPTA